MKIIDNKLPEYVEVKDIPVGGCFVSSSCTYMRISLANTTVIKPININEIIAAHMVTGGLTLFDGNAKVISRKAELHLS
jgi:hypothetical protein